MSEMSDTRKRGMYMQLDTEGNLDRVTKLLAGFPHGADKAIGSALKRAASSGETVAAKALTKEYYLKQGDFKKYTLTKRGKTATSTAAGTLVEINYYGIHIPLIRFDTHIGKDGHIVTRVKRSSARKTINNAFKAQFGSHVGIYERVGEKRFPIRELPGPSTPQMMENNENVTDEMEERIRETFEKRLDHETTAILNGWRK